MAADSADLKVLSESTDDYSAKTRLKEFETRVNSGELSDNKLVLTITGVSPEEVKHLADILMSGKCQKGLEIYLNGNELGPEEAKFLADALVSGKCPEGLKIYLRNNELGPKGAKFLADALVSGKCPEGLKIYLKGNKLGLEGIMYFANAMFSGKCPKKLHLELCRNFNQIRGMKLLAAAVSSGRCPEGLSLEIGQGDSDSGTKTLAEAGAEFFAEALEFGPPKGLTLRLSDDRAVFVEKPKWIYFFAQALLSGKCPERLTLSLDNNVVGLEGIQFLAQALASGKCPKGLTLNLGRNLSPEEVMLLVQALLSGKCPAGLTLNLNWDVLTWEDQKRLLGLLVSDKCPPGLIISYSPNYRKDPSIFRSALTHSAQAWRCKNGIGAELDLKEALMYYQQAVKLGYPPAQQPVARLLQEKLKSESLVQTSAQLASVAKQSKMALATPTAAAAASTASSTLGARFAAVESKMVAESLASSAAETGMLFQQSLAAQREGGGFDRSSVPAAEGEDISSKPKGKHKKLKGKAKKRKGKPKKPTGL